MEKRKSFAASWQKDRVRDSGAYFFLAFLVVIKFWYYLIPLQNRHYWAGDFLTVTHMQEYFYNNLRQGGLVLWNSYITGGMPYLAVDYGAFYPFDLLIGLLFQDYFDSHRLAVFHALHYWLAGAFTFLYTRQLGLSRFPALFSSVCFMLGGLLLGHSGHRSIIQTFIWLPLILFFLDQALLQGKAFRAALAGFFLAVSFLAGHANFFYFVLLFLGFYFLFRIYLGIKKRSFQKIVRETRLFVVMGLVCLGLSATELLPILYTSLNTYHGIQPFEYQAQLPFPLFDLIHFLIPDYSQWAATDISEQLGYIGVLPLFFVFWAVIHQWKNLLIRFFVLLVLFSFIASLGELTPLYKFLFDFLPGLKHFRIPSRFNALIIFPLSVMAGFGFQYLLDKTGSEQSDRALKSLRTIFFLGLGAGLLGFLYSLSRFLPFPESAKIFSWPWGVLWKGFFCFLLIWIISYGLIYWGKKPGLESTRNFSIILLVGLDLLFLGRNEGGYLEKDQALSPPQARQTLAEMMKDPHPFRTNNFPGLMNLLYSSPQGIAAYDLETFLGYVGAITPREYLDIYLLSWKNPMLLDLLNIKYISGVKPPQPRGLKIWKIGDGLGNKQMELKEPTRISSLSLVSFLSNSTAISQGTETARVVLTRKDDTIEYIPVRAGIETAEWAIDRPGLVCSHKKALVADSWEITGQGYKGQAYGLEKVFSPALEVTKIGLEYLSPQGGLLIKKIKVNNRDLEDGMLKNRFQPLRDGISKNIYCLPRVFTIGRAKAATDEKELLELLEHLDPRETVLLSQLPPGYGGTWNSGFSSEEAEIKSYSAERVEILTRAGEDKFLVLADTYSPFWQARIDGRPSPVLKVNGGLRGLYVPKGNHRIEFSFHFYPFYYGLALTCFSLTGFLAWVFFLVLRRSSHRKN